MAETHSISGCRALQSISNIYLDILIIQWTLIGSRYLSIINTNDEFLHIVMSLAYKRGQVVPLYYIQWF